MAAQAYKFSFVTSRMSSLSANEAKYLRDHVCSQYGAFRMMVTNFLKGKMDHEDDVCLTFIYNWGNIVGWVLVDPKGSYKEIPHGGANLMFYVLPAFRKMGLAEGAIRHIVSHLKSFDKLYSYAFKEDHVIYFFKKMSNRFGLNIEICEPILYLEK